MSNDEKSHDTIDSYFEYMKTIGQLKREGKIKLDSIPLYLNLKINLVERKNFLQDLGSKFRKKEKEPPSGIH